MALLRTSEIAQSLRPSMLVTGFSNFPGAPENPTEWLMNKLARNDDFHFPIRFAVLPVSYKRASDAFDDLIQTSRPDISLHFGLAAEAEGFRLEQIARGGRRLDLPDVDGETYNPDRQKHAGSTHLQSSLPLDEIETRLKAADLPVERSNDAGGYLCDFLFHQSCAHTGTQMAGFIHVPWLEDQCARFAPDKSALSESQLEQGARLIIEIAARCWNSKSG